jgi:hypothetical protein
MNRRYLKAFLALIAVFALALPAFYYFAYGKNDGLQQTVSQGGGNPAPVWTPPLSYGSNPWETFVLGLVGLSLVFALAFGFLRLARARRDKHGTPPPDAPHRP